MSPERAMAAGRQAMRAAVVRHDLPDRPPPEVFAQAAQLILLTRQQQAQQQSA